MEVNNITVLRKKSEPDWTQSTFEFDGKFKGVGVEDEKRLIKQKGETCIDCGLYWMDLRISPKFSKEYFRDDNGNLLRASERKTEEQKRLYHTPHEMLWVRDPANFQFILWHWGNTDDDTDGCYIVGCIPGVIGTQKGVINSRKKYVEIYPIIWRSIMKGRETGKRVTVLYKEVA